MKGASAYIVYAPFALFIRCRSLRVHIIFMGDYGKMELKNMTNCPNCGAVITGDKCEYCGTVFRRKEDNINILLDGRAIARAVREEQNKIYETYRNDIIVERDAKGRLRPVRR